MTTIGPKEKAAVGFWLLRQAILDLLKEPQNQGGLKATHIKEVLELWSKNDEKPEIAQRILHLMVADGELVSDGNQQPSYSLPGAGVTK
jgi:hypothetical protein